MKNMKSYKNLQKVKKIIKYKKSTKCKQNFCLHFLGKRPYRLGAKPLVILKKS